MPPFALFVPYMVPALSPFVNVISRDSRGGSITLGVLSCMALWGTIVPVRHEILTHQLTRAITVSPDAVSLAAIASRPPPTTAAGLS